MNDMRSNPLSTPEGEFQGHFTALSDALDQGYCLIEVLFDEAGRPNDYRFLTVNPLFEAFTGISPEDALSEKTVREIVPGLESFWFEAYGRVALTGDQTTFEQGSEVMNRWFEVRAFRVGDENSRKVGILFKDVTQKRVEDRERARLSAELEAERKRLRDAFEQASAFMATIRGEQFVFEYANPAYFQLVGHRDILGKPLLEALPEVEGQGYVEILQDVLRTGTPFVGRGMPVVLHRSRGGEPEERLVDFVYEPLREADGTVSGILVHGIDVTESRRAEQALREQQEREAFLLALGDRLRTFADPITVIAEASAALGRHLGVPRVGYGEIDPFVTTISVERDHSDGTIPSLAGESRPLDSFGPAIIAELLAGRTLRLDDIGSDPRSEPYAQGYESIGARSLLVVPLIKSARLRAVLYLHASAPRPWTDQDQAIAEEVAERTWAAVEAARAQSALRESEGQLRLVTDALPVLVSQIGPDLRYRFVNRAYTDWFSLAQDEAVGRHLREVLGETAFDQLTPKIQAVLAGETVRFEAAVPYKSGVTRHVEATYIPHFRLDTQEPDGFFALVADVDERRAFEEALRESRERLDLAVSAYGIGVYDWHVQTGRVLWSEEEERLFGLETGSFEGDIGGWASRVHPEDLQPMQDLISDAMARGDERLDFSFRIRRADGQVRHFEGSGRFLYAEDGTPLRMVGTNRDVTEREQARQDTARRAEQLRLALGAANAGAWDWDIAGNKVFWSPEYYSVYGLEAGTEPSFDRWLACIHEEDRDWVRGATDRALDAPGTMDVEFRTMHPQRGLRWLRVVGRTEFGGDGHPIRMTGIVYDTTEQREAQQELERRVRERTAELEASNRELEGFTHSIAHDLRAPLRAIVSTSRILMEEAAQRLAPQDLALLERQSFNAAKLSKLIDDLLSFARLSRAPLKRVPVNVTELASEAARSVLPTYSGRPFTLSIADRMEAQGDPAALRLVLENLIDNAAKYSPAGGEIQVGRADSGGAFFVGDQGIGLDMAYVDRIFRPFERLHRDEDYPGTGIGLANVKRIVERHGGRIWVESQPGAGATFLFTLG
jgi:PAS domain S-box-containing protein